MSATPGLPNADPQQYAEYLKAQVASQANTTGLTQMGPSTGGASAPVHSQPPTPGPQQNQTFGPGQRGASKRQSMQNLVKSVQGVAQQFSQYTQAKQQRQYEQTITRFTGATQGVQQAQAQVQQGQAMLKRAADLLKTNPQDPEAHQLVQQGQQLTQQGQTALKTNQAILNDMANDSKQHKIITKAFGIDDKNADSPERAAAVSALKKQMGVGDQAAGVMSQLPQQQQLSPAGQSQQMAREAGVVGAPPTGGQTLAAAGKAEQTAVSQQLKITDQTLKAEKQMSDAGLNTDKLIEGLPQRGLVAEKNEDGTIKRNPDGTVATRNLTPAELKDNPVLAAKWDENRAKIDLQVAQAKATKVNSAANMIRAQSAATIAQQAKDPNVIANYAKQLTDPHSGVTLGQVPAQMRGAVISQVVNSGQKIAKPLTSDELKRADLATNAVDNIEAAQAILARRPDLFGPGGWGKSKMELALAGGDPDAVSFQADIKLANLPAVGIHGVRGKYAIEDLQKLDSNQYLNKESMADVLGDIHRSASEFSESGGRKTETPAGNLKYDPATGTVH